MLLYDADGREEETDMVVASQHVTPEALRTLRKDAGGLVCTTLAPEHHERLGLPYLADMVARLGDEYPLLRRVLAHDLKYDPSKSTFSLTVNHRSTYTGIPDNDRAATIRALADLLAETDRMAPSAAQEAFGRAFRAPGHCILLNGAQGGLDRRQGHTELSLELARQAGLVPSTTICEMLGDDGDALPREAAEAYALRNGLVFLTGEDVLEGWRQRTPGPRRKTAKVVAPVTA